jgi:hypothetical protein
VFIVPHATGPIDFVDTPPAGVVTVRVPLYDPVDVQSPESIATSAVAVTVVPGTVSGLGLHERVAVIGFAWAIGANASAAIANRTRSDVAFARPQRLFSFENHRSEVKRSWPISSSKF